MLVFAGQYNCVIKITRTLNKQINESSILPFILVGYKHITSIPVKSFHRFNIETSI